MPNMVNCNGCYRARDRTRGLSPGLAINTLMLKANFLNSIPVIYEEVPQKSERCRVCLKQNEGIEKWTAVFESSSTLAGGRKQKAELVTC